MNQKTLIAVGLGSNLGDRLKNLEKAFAQMSEDLLESPVSSRVYESEPWGITDQPLFLNAVVVGESDWKPPAIVNFLKTLERELGRTSTVKNGPRVIDLDLLCWGHHTWDEGEIQVPHRGLPERDFVLLPLQEVWPDWVHPIFNKSVNELVKDFLLKSPSTAKLYGPEPLGAPPLSF